MFDINSADFKELKKNLMKTYQFLYSATLNDTLKTKAL
jgi:hypothetical protein